VDGRSERMTPKEASRKLPNGAVELTGAKDADGIPVELTSRDVERMGGEATAEYKDRREKLIAERKAKAEGGTKRDAEGAYRAHRNEQVAAATSPPPPACNELDGTFRAKISKSTAHETYEAWREGNHDDLVPSGALACWAGERYPRHRMRVIAILKG
jgi:hypothetical protein